MGVGECLVCLCDDTPSSLVNRKRPTLPQKVVFELNSKKVFRFQQIYFIIFNFYPIFYFCFYKFLFFDIKNSYKLFFLDIHVSSFLIITENSNQIIKVLFLQCTYI